MDVGTPPGLAPVQHFNFSDINSLESLKLDPEKGLEAAAQQFESLFMDIVLKSMRSAGKVFSEGNYLSSSETELHQEMLDHQWAIHLAENGGIGLSDVIVDQLGGGKGKAGASSEAIAQALASLAPDPSAGPTSGNSSGPELTLQASGTKQSVFKDPAAFVQGLLPVLQQTLQGTPFSPLVLAAQSALETGWGQKLIHGPDGRNSHNLFGIKAGADWQGPAVEVKTVEYVMQRPVTRTEKFRAYDSFKSAVEDYVAWVGEQPRYQQAREVSGNPGAYLNALEQAGYATDPNYAEKIGQILNSPMLRSLVNETLTETGVIR